MKYEFWMAGIQGVVRTEKNQIERMYEIRRSDLLYRRNTIAAIRVLE